MMTLDNPTTRHQRETEQKNTEFGRWMDDPLVRMGLSTIPPGDHPDALKILLRSAFDCGFRAGQGAIAGSLVEAMIDSERKRNQARG